jgi:hypothetical protein
MMKVPSQDIDFLRQRQADLYQPSKESEGTTEGRKE